jgi:hypothetical protein
VSRNEGRSRRGRLGDDKEVCLGCSVLAGDYCYVLGGIYIAPARKFTKTINISWPKAPQTFYNKSQGTMDGPCIIAFGTPSHNRRKNWPFPPFFRKKPLRPSYQPSTYGGTVYSITVGESFGPFGRDIGDKVLPLNSKPKVTLGLTHPRYVTTPKHLPIMYLPCSLYERNRVRRL